VSDSNSACRSNRNGDFRALTTGGLIHRKTKSFLDKTIEYPRIRQRSDVHLGAHADRLSRADDANVIGVVLDRHQRSLRRRTMKLSSRGEVPESLHAPAVCCSAWILFMALLGWAGACPKGNEIGAKPRLKCGSGRVRLPATMRAQAPHPTQGVHDALLQPPF